VHMWNHSYIETSSVFADGQAVEDRRLLVAIDCAIIGAMMVALLVLTMETEIGTAAILDLRCLHVVAPLFFDKWRIG
jgi:hypothetical protein